MQEVKREAKVEMLNAKKRRNAKPETWKRNRERVAERSEARSTCAKREAEQERKSDGSGVEGENGSRVRRGRVTCEVTER
ncbi:hypothetical protein R1flu_025294 [Riccia fluitans]|uniref:Uncharacterized protein n=1 Tax=Riccia fluitans TaxID=41844 RepID=A0ABD1XXI8_9MARC